MNSKIPTVLKMSTVAGVTAALLAGCSAGTSSSNAELEVLAADCDPAQKPATLIRADVSGTSQSDSLLEQHLNVARDVALTTAICGGTFRYDIFGSSIADSYTVKAVAFEPEGATESAKLRRAAKEAEAVVNEIEAAYPEAMSHVSANGTDVVSALPVGKEFIDQVNANGGTYMLHLIVLSDGLDNQSAPLDDPTLDAGRAQTYAATVPTTDLTGASVSMLGIGRISGISQLPSTQTDAVKAFYDALLARSGASSVMIATDYTSGR